jgi:hypothetical protein
MCPAQAPNDRGLQIPDAFNDVPRLQRNGASGQGSVTTTWQEPASHEARQPRTRRGSAMRPAVTVPTSRTSSSHLPNLKASDYRAAPLGRGPPRPLRRRVRPGDRVVSLIAMLAARQAPITSGDEPGPRAGRSSNPVWQWQRRLEFRIASHTSPGKSRRGHGRRRRGPQLGDCAEHHSTHAGRRSSGYMVDVALDRGRCRCAPATSTRSSTRKSQRQTRSAEL